MSVPDDMIRPWHAHIELGTGGTGKINLTHFYNFVMSLLLFIITKTTL